MKYKLAKSNVNNIHGWLIIDKPTGITSCKVVTIVKRLFGGIKCGHAGTLDPLACGVLPIALGEATKIIPMLMTRPKRYEFTITWGEQRSTDDSEGEIVAKSNHRPTDYQIAQIMPSFMGEISQVPPCYSAVKIAGMRACDRVRRQEQVTLQPRKVMVYSISHITSQTMDSATFEITCGQGTYVRSIARDIAKALGSEGYASMICRTRVGLFEISNSLPLETLANISEIRVLNKYIQPFETVLDDIPAVRGNEKVIMAILHGQCVELNMVIPCNKNYEQSSTVLVYSDNYIPIALAQIKQGQLWPKKVFNINNQKGYIDVD